MYKREPEKGKSDEWQYDMIHQLSCLGKQHQRIIRKPATLETEPSPEQPTQPLSNTTYHIHTQL